MTRGDSEPPRPLALSPHHLDYHLEVHPPGLWFQAVLPLELPDSEASPGFFSRVLNPDWPGRLVQCQCSFSLAGASSRTWGGPGVCRAR